MGKLLTCVRFLVKHINHLFDILLNKFQIKTIRIRYLWVLPIRNTKEDGTYVDYWGEMKGANAIASKDGKIHDSKDTSDNDEYIKDAEGEKLFS